MPRWRRGIRKSALAALVAVAALLLAELALRWLHPQPLVTPRPDVWVPDDGLGWKRAPNLATAIRIPTGEVPLFTDGEGHRIPVDSAAADVLPEPRRKILALGDSLVAGLQVEAEETLSEGLARALTEILGEPTEVVNAAVSGWGPEQYLEAARRELARASYDLVVVFLTVEDDTRLEPRKSPRPGASPSLPELPALRSPEKPTDGAPSAMTRYLQQRSQLFVAARRALGGPSRLPPVFRDTDPESERWETTSHLGRLLAEVAEETGAESFFILLPAPYQVDPEEGKRRFQAVASQDGGPEDGMARIRFANGQLLLHLRRHALVASDPTPTLQRARRAGVEIYGKRDRHLTASGHRAVAAYVAPQAAALLRRTEEESP